MPNISTVTWPALLDFAEFPMGCQGDNQCEWLLTCHDASGTGDSPAAYECVCPTFNRCPRYDDYIESLNNTEE
jgi:hypothetical protein